MARDDNSSAGSRTVERALTVLDIVSANASPMRLSDIAHAAGFDISTTSRLLTSLQRGGVIMRDPDTGRFRLGYKLLHLAVVVQQQSGLQDVAEPVLRGLVDAFNETATVNVLLDSHIIVAARVVCANQLRIYAPIGSRGPLYCTAAGKAILASQTDVEIERLLNLGMPRLTSRTITEPAAMREELAIIRAQGYAVDRGEREDGLIGIASPIRDAAGTVFASCGVSGAAARISADRFADFGARVSAAAAEISSQLGWQRERESSVRSQGAQSKK